MSPSTESKRSDSKKSDSKSNEVNARLMKKLLDFSPEMPASVLANEDPRRCAALMDELVQQGNIEQVRHLANALHECFKDRPYFATMRLYAGCLPAMPQTGWPNFIDDRLTDFQCIEKPGARATILGFCGRGGRLGMPLSLAQAWFSEWPVNVIYLRDFSHRFFLAGIDSIPGGYESLLVALRTICDRMGNVPLACVGNSGGSYSALKLGLELDAVAALCMSGPTNLEPGFLRENSTRSVYTELNEWDISQAQDLRPGLLDRAIKRSPLRVRLVFGEHAENDKSQANNLNGIPGVELCELPDWDSHNVLSCLISRGLYRDYLRWLLDSAIG